MEIQKHAIKGKESGLSTIRERESNVNKAQQYSYTEPKECQVS